MIAPIEKGLSNTMHNKDIGTFSGETPGLRKDGMIIPTEVSGKGIWDENGNYQGPICIVRDITERKRTEEAIKKYARELEQADQLKDLFTDIIRHDLLNPVTVIKGLSEILSEDESLPENRKSLETILSNVGKLEEMIQSTATLAKVESVDKLDFEKHNLCEILTKVISDFTPMFRNKGMIVEFFGEEKCIAEVNPYIEEIFSNLLSNAVKYSPENTQITVGIKADGEDWIVSVKDRGDRIPDEYKEIIFERFKRIEKRGVKGTGLGLSIVKRIVDIHKGKVWVEDNPEGGNIFLVRIPAKRSDGSIYKLGDISVNTVSGKWGDD
jgi:signal transduction histidine kinase